ncbi:hypothetical protein AFERRI_110022 [Acidithiobacillus ferrivorans]|uniref:Uncharacterized protein n=1 Tax=Acidithiobacillus ferrivorans TaxID=160808 RepID=A0A060UPX8_9PROT|nr:hypothetical protein AFERRI_110022 [Acidithiobacillus ferrivorans]
MPVHLYCNASTPIDPLGARLDLFIIGAEIDGVAG